MVLLLSLTINFSCNMANRVSWTRNSKFPWSLAYNAIILLVARCLVGKCKHMCLNVPALLDTWPPVEMTYVENVSLVDVCHQLGVHGECFH